ncbi:heterokaryon incompatibility protein-domain-containing protein [Cladorrhinum samala]|uniref:Heterokaryon incompatibility protein-domain-containing protein n=1 Tax=Cladorrhinum samala TaxID=585594 RepID=A0AAV9HMY8_9PEZI|nr:heterokaryon incompatibility protein-domain-containing protein [Cladorrhinum samala]
MATLEASTVCERCGEIFKHAGSLLVTGPPEDKAPRILRFDKLYQAQIQSNMDLSKCHMCSLLGTSLSNCDADTSDNKSGEQFVLEVARGDMHGFLRSDAVYVSLMSYDSDSKVSCWYGLLAEIETAKNPRSPTHVCVLKSPVTWSSETLNRIRSWLGSCIESHGDCPKPGSGGGTLPRRLIDVMPVPPGIVQGWASDDGTSDDFDLLSLEQSPNVRIVSSQSLAPDTPYLTLSHRWGDPPKLLLTKATSFLLQDNIASYLLACDEAAVFRHAIHVTRGLGFRFLWIDALCIMQDDEAEKTQDIMQMDAVYCNSSLNISAVEGRVREGLMFRRNLFKTNPCQVTVRIPKLGHHVNLVAFHGRDSLGPNEGPLNKRGWVFQERALSPRVAHFTEHQMYWECNTLQATETLPQGLQLEDSTPLSRSNMGTMIFSSTIEKLKEQWCEVTGHYSGTTLTFPSDRLVALSALSKRFCMAMGREPSDYLAGIWKNDLPLSLLWFQENGGLDASYNQSHGATATAITPQAPTWSWASLMVSVAWVEDSPSLAATAEVLDTQVTRISANFFDGLHFCRLRIRGWLCKFRRYVKDESAWIHVSENCEFEELVSYGVRRGIDMIWDTSRWPVATTHSDCVDDKENAGERTERGIVLWRMTERGTYTRIGYFMMPSTIYYRGSKMEDSFKGNLNTLSQEDYLERHSDGKYTIDIL